MNEIDANDLQEFLQNEGLRCREGPCNAEFRLTVGRRGAGVHTEAESLEELREMGWDVVACSFEDRDDRPSLIRLHFVRDEFLAI